MEVEFLPLAGFHFFFTMSEWMTVTWSAFSFCRSMLLLIHGGIRGSWATCGRGSNRRPHTTGNYRKRGSASYIVRQ